MKTEKTYLEKVAEKCSKCEHSHNLLLTCDFKDCSFYPFLFGENMAITTQERKEARAKALTKKYEVRTDKEIAQEKYYINKIKGILETAKPTDNLKTIAKTAGLTETQTKNYIDKIYNFNQ